jgi:hypothetical protein
MSSTKLSEKQKILELIVVFDTSVLFTKSEAYLVRSEVSKVIGEHCNYSDLKIVWFIPAIVREERKFQMQKEALTILPHIERVERLLNHKLNITEAILLQCVEQAIDSEMKRLNLQLLEMDTTKVDWERLIKDACERHPPFADTDNEKGFRDSLIAESFMQLVDKSPKSLGTCRIIFISNDKLLVTAIQGRLGTRRNVRVLSSTDELVGLINTLVEKVSEAFVSKYKVQAEKYFWTAQDVESLFYKAKIEQRINKEQHKILASYPKYADGRTLGSWTINPPRFIKKEGQRIFWASRIDVEAEAYKYSTFAAVSAFPTVSGATGISSTDWPTVTGAAGTYSIPLTDAASISLTPHYTFDYGSGSPAAFVYPGQSQLTGRYLKESVSMGRYSFDVIWSTIITQRGKFTKPRIESVNYIDTSWNV